MLLVFGHIHADDVYPSATPTAAFTGPEDRKSVV